MNTQIDINTLTSWDYISSDMNHARIATPFTLADDGEVLCLSIIFPSANSFYLSDDYQVAMHASNFGIVLDRRKIEMVNKAIGVEFAKMESDGEIVAAGDISTLQEALFDAVKLAMYVSFKYEKWMPKFNTIRFRTLVGKALKKSIDESKIIVDYSTTGASGHTIKLPYAIKTNSSNILIETIAASDNKSVNWDGVYRSHGRFSDIKQIDNFNKRLIIIERSSDKKEFDRASSFLADVASIRTLDSTSNWAQALKIA